MASINHWIIEVGECGLVHTLHEPIEGPVIAGDRGSKKYVCGEGVNPYPWPDDPFFTKTFSDEPELFVEYSPPMGIVAVAGGQVNVSQSGSFDNDFSSYSYFEKTVIVTEYCGCKPPDDVPIVPVAGSGVLLATALALGFMLKRA